MEVTVTLVGHQAPIARSSGGRSVEVNTSDEDVTVVTVDRLEPRNFV